MSLGDHVEDRRRDILFLTQPEVEHLLDAPGDFAEFAQADHAARALEGVEGTADVGQRLDIVRLLSQRSEIAADRLENFLGFLDEDGEQLGIQFLFVGLGKL